MAAPEPLFTVVIPTYRRPGRLAECLAALALLDYPSERFEALVVADEEGEGSLPAPLEDAASRPLVRFLRQPHSGPAVARNTGAREARGRYLAFTDDDCAPARDWLAKLEAGFTATRADVVGGRTVNGLPGNLFSEASQLLLEHVYRYYNADPCAPRFFASNNLAVQTDAFRRIGGFDPSYGLAGGEDRDLCDRLVHAGGSLVYRKDAVVAHSHELSLSRFWRQHQWYGQGAYRFHRARAARHQEPVRVEPPRFYRDLLAIPFDRHRGVEALALTGLMALSQIANAAGFFGERSRQNRRPAPGAAAAAR
jgi:GT2 family glycosyltransferase